MGQNKGYVYIENGKPVCNTDKRPEYPKMARHTGRMKKVQIIGGYNRILSAWNDSCMEVENPIKNNGYSIDIPGDWWREIHSGQPVTFLVTGEKQCKITSIN